MERIDLTEQHRAAINRNAFANNSGVVIDIISEDFVEAHIDVTENTLNPFGTVHGGAYHTLADVAAGFAARSRGKSHVTRSSSMTYLRAVSGGRITCRAEVISRSHTFCVSEARIYDDAGSLLCIGTFDYYCVDK